MWRMDVNFEFGFGFEFRFASSSNLTCGTFLVVVVAVGGLQFMSLTAGACNLPVV